MLLKKIFTLIDKYLISWGICKKFRISVDNFVDISCVVLPNP